MQRTDEWFTKRIGKATSSCIDKVMSKPELASYCGYRDQKVLERYTFKSKESGYVSYAMQQGIEREEAGRLAYQRYAFVVVEEIDFVDHPRIKNAGASPDGLVMRDGLVEIKCPQPTAYLDAALGRQGWMPRAYMLQMQFQMACTEREWCDYVVYDPDAPLIVQRIWRDAKQIAAIEKAVEQFLAEVDELTRQMFERYPIEAAA